MNTVSDNLRVNSLEIAELLKRLLIDHSTLHRRNDDYENIVVIDARGNHIFHELQEPGRRLQAKLLQDYRQYASILKTLMKGQSQQILGELKETDIEIMRIIEQQPTWCSTTQEVVSKAEQALKLQLDLLNTLFDPSDGEFVFVPDTNALLHNPDLERWSFNEAPTFTLVLTPTILSELDELKMSHRNEAVRVKAEKLISRIKEYRRRGSLSEGVPLVNGKSTIMAMAIEPVVQNSLYWLDQSINDDRFIASVIEIMRSRPRSVVIAISRDVNLQNKAEWARLPVIEPPEPRRNL
jgi:hypothetical protein